MIGGQLIEAMEPRISFGEMLVLDFFLSTAVSLKVNFKIVRDTFHPFHSDVPWIVFSSFGMVIGPLAVVLTLVDRNL